MKLALAKASTDVTVYIFIQNSSSTTGAGLTGLVYNSSSLTCYYVRPLAAAAQLTLATQTVTGAHSDGGFVEVDATNMPGWYRLDLSDAICATGVPSVGIILKGATNMAPVNLEIQLTSVNLNDSVRGGMTALPNAAADAAGGLPISDAGGLDMDAILSRIGTPTNLGGGSATLAGNLQDIEAQTDDIGAAGAGLTAVPWNAAWDAEVQSEVQDAIEVNHLDHLLAADYDPASKPGVATALLNELVESDAGVSRFTANALEQAPSGTGASAASIADAVWDEARADHTSAGSFGQGVASVQGNVTGSVDSVTTVNDKTGYRLSATGVDDVWDEAQSGHTTAGTFGRFLDAQVANVETDTQDIQGRLPAALVGGRMDSNMGAISGDATAADNLEAALDGTGGVTISAGLTGNITGNLSGSVGSVTGAVGSVTGNVGGNVAGSVGSVTGAVGSVTGNVGGNVAGSVASVTGAVGSVTALSAAAVDSILDEALTELAAVPAAAPSLRAAIQFLYMALRNRSTTTASAQTIQDDAGATIGTASLSDDGTTYTKGEFA